MDRTASMTNLHRRLEELGQQQLLLEADSARTRQLVDIAFSVMSDDRLDRAYVHPAMCLTTLPHRRRPTTEIWNRVNGPVTLTIQPTADRHGRYYGVPYGPKARLILLYLQTEAIKSGCRQVELGSSMRSWLARMNIAIGGKNMAEVREQSRRIERALISVAYEGESGTSTWQDTIIRGSFEASRDREIMAVELSETFYKAIRDRPVPVSEAAIRALGERAMALDVYIWLAYRLHALNRPVSVSWKALHGQFGAATQQVKHWKARFVRDFEAAVAAYPSAEAELTDYGVRLHPSPPPIGASRVHAVAGPGR